VIDTTSANSQCSNSFEASLNAFERFSIVSLE